MDPKPVDPNNIEGHTKAHKEAFDALIERMSKAVERQKEAPKLGSRTHKAYPKLGHKP